VCLFNTKLLLPVVSLTTVFSITKSEDFFAGASKEETHDLTSSN
jgi:hypothetical protein